MRYEENAAYPQALIICPENNHAEITYGSAWPLSHTLIPVQTCSCWNWLCSVQFKIFGKAQAESDQGKAAIGPLPAFWNYGHTDRNGKVCALKLSSRLYFGVLFMIFIVWWVVRGKILRDPQHPWIAAGPFPPLWLLSEPGLFHAEHPPDCAWLQHLLLHSPICLPHNWSIAKAKLSKRCPSNDGNYMIN